MEDQTQIKGLGRVRSENPRPRPHYKSMQQDTADSLAMWKSIALGLAGLLLIALFIIVQQMRGMAAVVHGGNIVTIEPGVK